MQSALAESAKPSKGTSVPSVHTESDANYVAWFKNVTCSRGGSKGVS